MIKKLYVIGNGFDIHHGINSKYSSFREFCRINDEDLYLKLENYYNNCDLLWSNFEIGLSELNFSSVMDFAKIGHDNWNSSWKGMYAFVDDVRKEVDFLQISLKMAFVEWIEQLEKGDVKSRLFFIWDDALFLSFNYTHTLERLYSIPQNRICYIHGRASNQFSQLIFGHCFDRDEIKEKMSNENELEEEATIEIVNCLMALRKDSHTIIQQNKDFFEALKNVEDVYVLGHSLSIVDDLYFEKINEAVPPTSNWIVSWHCDADKKNLDRLRDKLNLPLGQFKPIKIKNIGNEFYPALKFDN